MPTITEFFKDIGMAQQLYLSPEFVYIFGNVFFAFFCFTIPLYIFILILLIKAQKRTYSDLATPFFQIFIVSSIIDIVTLLNNYFGAVFPRWGWWTEIYRWMGRPYIVLYFYIAWATGICQAISVSLIASNRLYAMLFPETYKKFWTGWRLRFAFALQFAPGMIASLFNLVIDVELASEENNRGGVVPRISNKAVSKAYFSIGGGFLIINSIYLIAAYVFLYITLKKRHAHQIATGSRHRLNKTVSEAKRREHRLFLMSTSIVIVQLVIILFFATFVFPFFTITVEQFYLFYSALSDLYSGVNPYLMLIFSDALRNAVLEVIICRTAGSPMQSVISTRPQRSQTTPHLSHKPSSRI